jgi:hypothetical protein
MPVPEAAALEELYFCNRLVYLQLREVETDLIRDYLAGRLPGDELERFEERYLTVPELVERVAEVRAMAGRPVPAESRTVSRKLWGRFALAVCSVGAVAISWVMRKPEPTAGRSPEQAVRRTVVSPSASIQLEAGLWKDGGNQLAVPAEATGPVRLQLKVPASIAGVACSVRISRVQPDGKLVEVWSSGEPLMPVLSGGGASSQAEAEEPQAGPWLITVDLPPSVATPASYDIELGWPGHRPGGFYSVEFVAQ